MRVVDHRLLVKRAPEGQVIGDALAAIRCQMGGLGTMILKHHVSPVFGVDCGKSV